MFISCVPHGRSKREVNPDQEVQAAYDVIVDNSNSTDDAVSSVTSAILTATDPTELESVEGVTGAAVVADKFTAVTGKHTNHIELNQTI